MGWLKFRTSAKAYKLVSNILRLRGLDKLLFQILLGNVKLVKLVAFHFTSVRHGGSVEVPN